MTTHAQIDARSLKAHRLVADRVEKNPSLRRVAVENVDRWMKTRSGSEPYLRRWRELLLGDLKELLAMMRSDSEEATALRQSTPFAGTAFIGNAERYQLIREYAQARD